MQSVSKGLRYFFVCCCFWVLHLSAHAAGIDFTIPFALTNDPINSQITNRHFNTVTGAADGQRLFTGTRLVETGASNSWVGLNWMQVTSYTGPSGAAHAEGSNSVGINDWPMGLTYDSTARRAVLVTLGGEGFLYQRNPSNQVWSVLHSMENMDLNSLVYFPPQNSFYGLRDGGSAIFKFDSSGQKVDEFQIGPLPVIVQPGSYHSELVAVGDRIIMLIGRYPFYQLEPDDYSRIYVINPVARTSELTFEARQPSPPRISFILPGNNSSMTLGQTNQIKLSYFDPDNDVRTIRITDGNTLLREYLLDPGPQGTNILELPWIPTTTGLHELHAVVTDTHNLVASATTVSVTVNPVPQTNLPPQIRILQPAADTNLVLGRTINFRLSVFDPNNDLQAVTIFDGQNSVRNWVISTNILGTNILEYAWIPGSGSHFVTALATDKAQLRGTSGPVQINVTIRTNPPPTNLNFRVYFYDGSHVLPVDYNQDGALDGGRLFRGVPLIRAGQNYFGKQTQSILKIDSENGIVRTTSPAPDVPELSWPRDVAFDSLRYRAVVASLGGEGYLYAIAVTNDVRATSGTPETNGWSLISSMNNLDVDSLCYYPTLDRLFAVENLYLNGTSYPNGTLRIRRITSQGVAEGVIQIPDVPFDIGSSYQTRLVLSTNNAEMALLIEPSFNYGVSNAESRIYSINPVSGIIALTYRKLWDQWPPPVLDPSVVIVTPTNGATFASGTNTLLSARAFNYNFNLVTFYTNNVKVRDVSGYVSTGPYQLFSLMWSNLPVGTISLKAVGRTVSGIMITSAPVNIYVTNSSSIFIAERDLPTNYWARQPVPVSIRIQPSKSTLAWSVEETPPEGWTISQINHDGVYDAKTRKIKWGPVTQNVLWTLTYMAAPPTNATGLKTFSGAASVNGVSQAITGDQTIVPAPIYHPADYPQSDYNLTMNEVTAYAAAWRAGTNWNVYPWQIPLSYVTRAGFLWRSGERYQFLVGIEEPLCWVPASNSPLVLKGALPLVTPSEVTRVLPPAYTAGHPTTVTLHLRPSPAVQAYAIEERPPAGWTIINSGEGTVVGGALRFGPYFDTQERTQTYTLVPPNIPTRGEFHGDASFDGSADSIRGGGIIPPPTPVAERSGPGHIRLRFNATPGEQFVVECADSVEARDWQTIATITGADTPVEIPEIEISDVRKFYRLRPLP